MSSPTPIRIRKGVHARDGHACAWHAKGGCDPETLVPQHRQGGMGGRKTKHRLSNVVWLCSRINGDIESNADLQREAVNRGIKISLHANPAREPMLHAVHGWVVLDDDGGVTSINHVRADRADRAARLAATVWPSITTHEGVRA